MSSRLAKLLSLEKKKQTRVVTLSHTVSGPRHTAQPLTAKRCPLEHGNHHVFIVLEAHSHYATLTKSHEDTVTLSTPQTTITVTWVQYSHADDRHRHGHPGTARSTLPLCHSNCPQSRVRQSPESRQPEPLTYLRTLSLRRPQQ